MARGETEISHAAFEAMPANKTNNCLRDLLTALEVLPPFHTEVERVTPVAEPVSDHPAYRAGRRRAPVRPLAGPAPSTHPGAARHPHPRRYLSRPSDHRRHPRFMGWLAQSGTPITEITQADLDRDVEQHHGRPLALAPFLSWCARTGLGQELTAHDPTRPPAGRHPWPMTTGRPTSNCCCTTTGSDHTAASRACSSCSTPKSWPGSLACVPSRSATPPVVSSPPLRTPSLSSCPSRSTVSCAPT